MGILPMAFGVASMASSCACSPRPFFFWLLTKRVFAFPELEGAYSITRPPIKTKAEFIACKKLIADERRRRYMLPRRAFLRLRSLALRGRAKPDSLLAAVARLPNEMAWHVLSFWPAEADVAPPLTPSPRS